MLIGADVAASAAMGAMALQSAALGCQGLSHNNSVINSIHAGGDAAYQNVKVGGKKSLVDIVCQSSVDARALQSDQQHDNFCNSVRHFFRLFWATVTNIFILQILRPLLALL